MRRRPNLAKIDRLNVLLWEKRGDTYIMIVVYLNLSVVVTGKWEHHFKLPNNYYC